ncbi:MAG: hypothetical protein GY765_01265 [bacterium]|nr:hypothetical protein [bacterium]
MKTYKITLLHDILEIDLEKELPAKLVYKDTRIFGALALFFGSGFVLMPLFYFVKAFMTSAPIGEALPALGMAVVFLPLAIIGANLLFKKKELIIDSTRISKNISTLFRKEKWEEDVSNYLGLMLHTDVQITGERSSRMIYVLEMFHEDENKIIRLYKNFQYKEVSAKWKSYSRIFNLPLLERIGKKEYFIRASEDIDKEMADLLKEGKIPFEKEPGPPPQGIEVKSPPEGETVLLPDGTRFTAGEKGFNFIARKDNHSLYALEYEAVGAVAVDYCQRYKKWSWSLVVIERERKSRFVLGHGLPDETLEWLQHYLLKILAEKS